MIAQGSAPSRSNHCVYNSIAPKTAAVVTTQRRLVRAAQVRTATMRMSQPMMNAISGTWRWAARQTSRFDHNR
jgi:hypothetical protein